MDTRRVAPAPVALARLCGALYLVVIVLGIYGEVFIRGRIVVSGNAVATAANIASMEWLWRIGIANELILLVCATLQTIMFLILLTPVSRSFAWLATFFNLVSIAIEASASMYLVQALLPLGSAAYLKAFTPDQLYAMASMAVKAHEYAFGVALIFFGMVCMIMGYLIFKSGYIPRTVGLLMQIAGMCYLVNSLALIVSPHLSSMLYPAILVPSFIGELSLCLWLLVKGVNAEQWQQRGGRGGVLRSAGS